MKKLAISVACTLALLGCQSTTSSLTDEERSLTKNVCNIGDGDITKSQPNQWEYFRDSLYKCGGYDVFTEDMLVGKTFKREWKRGGKTFVYDFKPDGTMNEVVNESESQIVQWELDNNGFVLLTFKDGWKETWALLNEAGSYYSLKFYGRNEEQHHIWAAYMVETGDM